MCAEIFVQMTIVLFISLVLQIICTSAAHIPPESQPPTNRNEGTLIFSHLIWRHGDRAPLNFAPNDPYRSTDSWPVGHGELTNIGKQQLYQVGRWLRQRYDGFLPDFYSGNDIYVRCTDVDRTLASAYSNLAGLYPPSGAQIWNEDLLWQPIPVHTVPIEEDYLIGAFVLNCPKFDRLFAEIIAGPAVQSIFNKYKNISDYIISNSGFPSTNQTADVISDVIITYDTLSVETIYEKPLPEWTNAFYPGQAFDTFISQIYTLQSYTTDLARIRVGYILQEILDRSQAKSNGTLKPDRKVWAYSAHDLSISAILNALDLMKPHLIQYAAMLLFELYRKEDGVYLSIFYRAHYDDAIAEQLFIPNCGAQCKLEEVYKLYADILPTQSFAKECAT